MSVIDAARQLVMKAGVALRAIPKVFAILGAACDPFASVPSASGTKWWLQRLGLFALSEPLDRAADWAYLIDHSVQIGTTKVCVIVGLRLSEWPVPSRPLCPEDVRLLGLIPTDHSSGEIVAQQLEAVAQRTGIPRQIVPDHGSDVKKGSELFAARQVDTVLVYDAAHHGACVLKRRFEADARWPEFLSRLSQTKSRLQQTAEAYLLSPSLRPKARYMNLAPVLRWARRILALMDRENAEGSTSGRAQARYGWLREFRAAIAHWSRVEATVRRGVEFVRSRGLSRECDSALARVWRSRPAWERHQALEVEWVQFVREQSAPARPHEVLVGSTEVLESVFGKWKNLERQESQSGITRLVLSLGALLGPWTKSRITTALEQTPVKHVLRWCERHLPPSVQSQRRLAFATSTP